MAQIDNQQLNEMMQAAGRGDPKAFRRFYEATAPAVLGILLRLLGDRYQAEDVLQETMVTAWDKAAEFDPAKAAARTWITTIARHRALDILRGQARRSKILEDQAGNVRLVLGLEQDDRRQAPTESTATGNRLEVCLDELTPDAASCIQLAYVNGLTFNEIAGHIDRSIGTVKSWVRRGLGKLKECLQR